MKAGLFLSASCFALFFQMPPLAMANGQPATPGAGLALVYEGPGSCAQDDGDCTGATETAVRAAGFTTLRVGPSALGSGATEADYQKIFARAAVWVQPGGGSKSFLKALTPEMRAAIRRFVKEGGGYVGFCAGAFSSTAQDGTLLDVQGLGIFPGNTHPYPNQIIDTFSDYIISHLNPDAYNNLILPVLWQGKLRSLYFEEGPRLNLSHVPVGQVEVIARFKNNDIAAARSFFGKGRVYITGAHPEAPLAWRTHPDLQDPDGLDLDLVADMLHWSKRGSSADFHPEQSVIEELPLEQSEPGVFLGQAAQYQTFLQEAGSELQSAFAKTRISVVGYDQTTDNYSLEIINEWVSGKKDYRVTLIEGSELASHSRNRFFQNCDAYNGILLSASDQGLGRASCKYSSSSMDFYAGDTIFLILKAVSVDASGRHFITVQQ